MDLELRDKVALVAAASAGLGQAVAYELAREGARLVIFSRSKERIDAAARAIRDDTGADVHPVVANVASVADVQRVVRETIERFSRVDILVTNGGGPPTGGFDAHDDPAYLEAFEQNFLGSVRLIRECLPYMKDQKWGRIINITSLSVKEPQVNLTVSNVVRLGLTGLSKTLSKEVARYNILINNLAPTSVFTERTKVLVESQARRENRSYDEVLAEREKAIPVGRFGRPDELAAMAVLLASPRIGYITGTTIPIDGGVSHSLF